MERFKITFEFEDHTVSGALLLHVAILLRQMRLNPESFGCVAENTRLKVAMLVTKDEQRIANFAVALREYPGIRSVTGTLAD